MKITLPRIVVVCTKNEQMKWAEKATVHNEKSSDHWKKECLHCNGTSSSQELKKKARDDGETRCKRMRSQRWLQQR